MVIDSEKIRNVALIGHSGEGKTTLCEAMLVNLGIIDRQGKVDDGNTVSDFDPEEIAKKSSISLSVACGDYKGYKFNIIDVPGFFDFEGEQIEALSVADSAIIVTGASGVLTVGTEKALDYCLKNKIPSMIFVTGLNKENSSFLATVDAIRAKYPRIIAPLFISSIVDDKFVGYIKVLDGKYYSPIGELMGECPKELMAEALKLGSSLVEAAAGNDEELMQKYFDEGSLSQEDIEKGVNIGVKDCSIIPVFGGSGIRNQGVLNLMNNIITLLPSPISADKQIAEKNGELIEIACDATSKTVLRVFKTIVDPFVGRLNIFKVISGTVKVGQVLHNNNKDNDEKVSSLYYIRGKKQEATQEVVAGDIGAFAKLTDVSTGDTLSDVGENIIFSPLEIPSAMYSMAVYAAKKGDEDKVFAGLSKLKDEDISFTVTKNKQTGEMLLSGIGETQLSILLKKLKNKFGCEAVLCEPKIAYRETIKKKAEAEGKHKKQSGGAGQYGHCKIRFEPGAEDGVYEFCDAVVGGAVPRQFIPAVDKGLREAINIGVLAGYPMVNLKCTLYDGSYHPVDSKEIAFVMAAKIAYQEGVKNASPCILEPIMSMKITIPDEYLGAVLGDMNKRRGRILGNEMVDGKQVVISEAPQSEIVKYATDLRSMTQGKGYFTAEFSRYEEVPPLTQEKIINDAKAANS